MNSKEVRNLFLEFFINKDHKLVKSSPLVPQKDPTLLFVNAGMNQFKNIFLGLESRDYKRATSSQKCMRAGGKHNDLEQVGKTNRHHTFFEMLGNFSFGDYFKTNAIKYAWELLTKGYKLPKENLYVTIYKDDDEAFNIWKNKIHIPEEKILRMGKKNNFWEMGDTGPCGPCSEIHYDRGNKYGKYNLGEKDGDRYVEIWNLVFMQYNKTKKNKLESLPSPSIDTGLGLERLVSILQNTESNYETDLFLPIIKKTEELTSQKYSSQNNKIAMRVIADHTRAICFLIADGVLPSNDGRGYVLRRIIRRAYRYGKDLGLNEPFLFILTGVLIDLMKDVYPELEESKLTISKICKSEEERFTKTLEIGYSKLKNIISTAKQKNIKQIDGGKIFKLYDTYGFPSDLATDILDEHNLTYNVKGFKEELNKQRDRARKSWEGDSKIKEIEKYRNIKSKVIFKGYDNIEYSSEIIGLFKGNSPVQVLEKGDEGEIIVKETPFYGEAGGQIGDTGIIENEHLYCHVIDTKKPTDNIITHIVKVIKGKIKKSDIVFLKVNKEKRWATRKNHTATHLLHKSLKEILGPHVKQSGSNVSPTHLRFDYTHFQALSEQEIQQIEDMINTKVQEDLKVKTETMPIEKALETGATAIFEEKYGDFVRVVSIDDFTRELCGGTHLNRTGEIGVFKIINDESISSGVRRIEAVTGEKAIKEIQKYFFIISNLKQNLNITNSEIINKVQELLKTRKKNKKQIKKLREKLLSSSIDNIIEEKERIGRINLIFKILRDIRKDELRNLADNLKNKVDKSVIVLAHVNKSKVSLVFSLTKDILDTIKAKEIIKKTVPIIDGGGGGRDDFGQAGGTKPEKLDKFKNTLKDVIRNAQ